MRPNFLADTVSTISISLKELMFHIEGWRVERKGGKREGGEVKRYQTWHHQNSSGHPNGEGI
jgi:hypothetical protein